MTSGINFSNSNLTNSFDFKEAFPFTQMLSDQVEGKNNSWAIRWYASTYLMNKLTLYPGVSLVGNIGNDGSGSHQVNSKVFETKISGNPVRIDNVLITESIVAKKAFIKYFLELHHTKFSRFIYRMRHFFGLLT